MSIRLNASNMSYQAIPGLITNRKNIFNRRLTVEEVAEGVALKTAVPVAMMRFKTRKQNIVHARQIVAYICTMIIKPGYTAQAIGDFFFLDHATILHARKNVANLIQTDKDFQYNFMMIIEFLNL